MKPEKIREVSLNMCNGQEVSIMYIREAHLMSKRNYEKEKLIISLKKLYGKDTIKFKDAFKEAKKRLPGAKEGACLKSLYVISEYKFTYDERDYFRQVLEETSQNLNPVKDSPDYKKVGGMLYRKGELEYIRFAIREDRLNTVIFYSYDKAGKNLVEYDEIEEYLIKSARRNYTSYNRQDTITSTGKVPEHLVKQITLRLDRVKSIS